MWHHEGFCYMRHKVWRQKCVTSLPHPFYHLSRFLAKYVRGLEKSIRHLGFNGNHYFHHLHVKHSLHTNFQVDWTSLSFSWIINEMTVTIIFSSIFGIYILFPLFMLNFSPFWWFWVWDYFLGPPMKNKGSGTSTVMMTSFKMVALAREDLIRSI